MPPFALHRHFRIPAAAANLVATALLLAGALVPTAAQALTPAEALAPMRVTLVQRNAPDCGSRCARWIAMQGKIGLETVPLFQRVLDRAGPGPVAILIDSPGGAVQAALAIGRLIRARGLAVAVAETTILNCLAQDSACLARQRSGARLGSVQQSIASCASACVLVLAAGTKRYLAPNAHVGVHQMINRQTFTRVINMVRITRRLIGGRVVEVSRTLISTRPVSSKIVTSKAPEAAYDEVAHFLMRMGIGDDIMPLMRATPPSGIHWMTVGEVASTRIATERRTADAMMADIEAATAVPVARTADEPASFNQATLTQKGDTPPPIVEDGIVTWSVTGSPVASALMGEVSIPARHLHGLITITPDRASGPVDGLTMRARFTTNLVLNDRVVTWVGSPVLGSADGRSGIALGTPAIVDGVFTMTMPVARADAVQKALVSATKLSLPLVFTDHVAADLSMAIGKSGHSAIISWLHLWRGEPAAAPASPPSRDQATRLASLPGSAAAEEISPVRGRLRGRFPRGGSTVRPL